MLTDKIIRNQYDFDQDLISERVVEIQPPYVMPQIRSSRVTGSGQRYQKYQYSDLNTKAATSKQFFGDFQMFMQKEKEQQQTKIQQYKKKQRLIGQQVKKYEQNKNKRINQIQEEQRNKLLQECTFKPKINANNSQKRDFNQFLQHQKQHIEKVNAKKENIKKEIDDKKIKQTFKPVINNKKKSNVPVFQRLYDSREKDSTIYQQKHSFQPTITQKSRNMARGLPIDQLLYCDALRRQQKIRQSQYISGSTLNQSNYHSSTSLKNQKYAAQKFIKEYFFALNQLEIRQGKIDYIMFNELLRILGFIMGQQSQSTNSTLQRALVHKAYQLIEQFEVNARNVCVFLLALLGIYHINPINFDQTQNPLTPQQELNYQVNEGRKVQKDFDLLYRNRLSSEGNRRVQKFADSYSFQPQINKESEQLAEKYRQKMLQQANDLLDKYPEIEFNIPQNGVISHSDLLVLHRIAKDIENSKKKLQKQDKILAECTFKPTMINSNQSLNLTLNNSKCELDGHTGTRKSFELYNQFRNIEDKKKSLKASRQIATEDRQCTFKPKINRGLVKESNVPLAKQTDEAIYRLRKGRQEHLQRMNLLQRGQKSKDNLNNSQSRVINQSSITSDATQNPHLIIDVNMGDRIEQILVFQGDQNRIPELARKFADKHCLDCQSQVKLVELLKAQIQSVLDKIDEDQDSDNDY